MCGKAAQFKNMPKRYAKRILLRTFFQCYTKIKTETGKQERER